MYFSGYNKIFWGFIFILIDVNIAPFDILPDAVGYLMIYLGLNHLASQHEIYSKGKLPAVILAINALRVLFKVENVNSGASFSISANLWLSALGAAALLVDLYLVFCICRGIYMVAESKGLEELKETAAARWKYYLFLNIVLSVYMPFSLNLPQSFAFVGIAIVLINIIVMLLILGLVSQAKTQLGD